MKKSITSKELIKIIEKDGWFLVNVVGSHCQFKHNIKKGRVTIPHPKNDMNIRTYCSILKQAQINREDL